MNMGTMDSTTSHILYTHIPALLPIDTSELPVAPLVRVAALMGVGLVYLGTEQLQLSRVMATEIAAASDLLDSVPSLTASDESDPNWTNLRECYAFSAGAALGLINLGSGRRQVVAELSLLPYLEKLAKSVKGVVWYDYDDCWCKILILVPDEGRPVVPRRAFCRTSPRSAQ